MTGLPLANPSIRAGVNQTVMLSFAMVVVVSLIGAKGLGEDVLDALQYANVGKGILAGFAILFCAMILDQNWHIEALQGHLHQAPSPQSTMPQQSSQGLT